MSWFIVMLVCCLVLVYFIVGLAYAVLKWRVWAAAWARRKSGAVTPWYAHPLHMMLFPGAFAAGRIGSTCTEKDLSRVDRGDNSYPVPYLAAYYQRSLEGTHQDDVSWWFGLHILAWPMVLVWHAFILLMFILLASFFGSARLMTLLGARVFTTLRAKGCT